LSDDYAIPGDDTSRHTPKPRMSDIFRKMADQIDRNEGADFGGAYVIVPPAGAVPVECLFLNSEKNLSQFWGALGFTVQKATAELDEQDRNQQAFRHR
jgi:hypothetical protein